MISAIAGILWGFEPVLLDACTNLDAIALRDRFIDFAK
jgi:hypothetical protein